MRLSTFGEGLTPSNFLTFANARHKSNRARRLINASFVLMVAVLMISAVVTMEMGQKALNLHKEIVKQSENPEIYQQLFAGVRNAETGQFRYLITDKASYLEDYRIGEAQAYAALELLVKNRSANNADIAELEHLARAKLASLDSIARIRHEQGAAAAAEAIEVESKNQYVRQMHTVGDRIAEKEQQSVAAVLSRLDGVAQKRTLTFTAILGFNLAVLSFALRRITRAFADQDHFEHQLLEQKQLLSVTLASIDDGVIVADTDGRIIFINNMAEKFAGRSSMEASGQHISQMLTILDEETRKPSQDLVSLVLQNGTPQCQDGHLLLVLRDGSELSVDESAAPIHDAGGAIRGVVLVLRDISKHKKAELEIHRLNTELTKRLSELKTLFNVAPIGIAVTLDAEASKFHYNPYLAAMLKLDTHTPNDTLFIENDWPKDFKAYWNESEVPVDITPARLAAKTGKPIENIDLRLVFHDGREISLFGSAMPLFDENGHCRGAIATYVDVTERRRVEQEARRLASIVEHSSDFIGIADMASNPTYVNKAGMAMLGAASFEELKKLPVHKRFVAEDQEFVRTVVLPTAARDGRWAGELRFRNLRTGAAIPILYDVFRIDDPKTGRPLSLATITRNITERKRVEAQLQRAKEDAEAANVAKDNFLATLSHELRTPLTPVSAILGSWELQRLVPARLIPDIQMMRRNVDLEARLIDDLLDLTRIVRGKLTLNPELTDVHELLSAVVNIYQSEIQAKGLCLHMKLNAKRHHVNGDPARLQQVFWNILKNSTKFTPEGGQIDVETETDPTGQVRVIFQDDGIGMTPELQARIFTPFEQGASERVRRYGGLGLGLAISKTLVEAHKGAISASSAGPGSGSTFTIRLPAAEVPAGQSEKPADESAASISKAANILMVEDHQDTARVIARLLRDLGHTVSMASTVCKAKELIDGGTYDLLLSDIGLPDGTGIDVVTYLRQKSSIPAIAMTGYGMEDDIARCKAAGFQEHLTKPIHFQRLQLLIEDMMRKA